MTLNINRRRFVQGSASAGALATIGAPVFAQAAEHTLKWACLLYTSRCV